MQQEKNYLLPKFAICSQITIDTKTKKLQETIAFLINFCYFLLDNSSKFRVNKNFFEDGQSCD